MTAFAPPPDPQFLKLAGWIFVLIGVPLGFFTLERSIDKVQSASWPSTYARIVSSEMYRQDGRYSSRWCVKLRYRYAVDGKVFSTNKVSTSVISKEGCDFDRKVIAARFERMQPGDKIKVRYDRADPRVAIVYVGEMDFLDLFFPVLAIVLVAGGTGLIRSGVAMRSKQAMLPTSRRV